MTTLINDEFADDEGEAFYGDIHLSYVVRGKSGWTDQLDRATVDLLSRIGAIVLYETVSGKGWQTNLYRSVEGVIPNV